MCETRITVRLKTPEIINHLLLFFFPEYDELHLCLFCLGFFWGDGGETDIETLFSLTFGCLCFFVISCVRKTRVFHIKPAFLLHIEYCQYSIQCISNTQDPARCGCYTCTDDVLKFNDCVCIFLAGSSFVMRVLFWTCLRTFSMKRNYKFNQNAHTFS